ncbi:integration host factor subunit alpha [Acidithiobacillus ferrivorans]|uniref:Integration host factor subunit alpha n=1 Tax=Acidithiobacillus ferrivorans TaxID=160808 RepID=A0A1B9BZY8_9PROT|nr:integration host factor subunit alpha [Acidithiobacillus ferrivorans]OCB03268.1 integration host factor subunit alpha [Acidithiobacillus ferrivorans]
MTVTKLDLTRHLLDTVGLTAKDCAALVDTFFDTIRSTLAAGEDVKLSGFGNFTLHEKRARPGRNPKNKEPIEITARRVVTFRASPAVKERCNEVKVLPAFGRARALAGD